MSVFLLLTFFSVNKRLLVFHTVKYVIFQPQNGPKCFWRSGSARIVEGMLKFESCVRYWYSMFWRNNSGLGGRVSKKLGINRRFRGGPAPAKCMNLQKNVCKIAGGHLQTPNSPLFFSKFWIHHCLQERSNFQGVGLN